MNDEEKNIFINEIEKDLIRLFEDKNAFNYFSLDDVKESFGLNIDSEIMIQKLIHNRKINSSLGICAHDDGYLCEHRKKYIINYVLRLVVNILNKGINTNDIQN